MSKFFQRNKIIPRYKLVAYVMLLFGVAIIVRALYVATAEREYWLEVASRLKKDSVFVDPVRGNILSHDGRLLASSLPEYRLYIDFKAGGKEKDSLWNVKVDSICMGLHEIFPEKSAAEFKKHLEEGHKKMSQSWPIWKKRVSYDIYSQVKRLPVFNLSPFKGGFYTVHNNARQHPFGSLAGRTIGDMYGAKDSARCGLELTYDSTLRGEKGMIKRRKVMNKYLSITDHEPVDGADIVTTIDVGMQDLSERAVIDKMIERNAKVGVAIVMEVATGDVKAIVNMTRGANGKFYEAKNNAVSDLLEPGSVFKTASTMVALDDGVVDTSYVIDTGSGIYPMHGAKMKDHNWHNGGCGRISLARAMELSSNIGISRVIDKYYYNRPEKFVEGLKRIGINEDLGLPFVGSSPPRIAMPVKNKKGVYAYASKTKLPWMSIGYETQIPPISTVTFYNAIANNGKMVKPRFVKQIEKNGEVIQEIPVTVMREKICSDATLGKIQTILQNVVEKGTGKKAGSRTFKVAGKTGTAQISKGAGGYKSGIVSYLLSFVGYFPADNPRYTCIVCLQKDGYPASGGFSAEVFHKISEGIMAQNLKLLVNDARDSLSIMTPQVKNGNMIASDYVLSRLNIKRNKNWDGSYAAGNPIWGKATNDNKTVTLAKAPVTAGNVMPDVTGMGARDAVYMLESRGIKVRIEGRGQVESQSIPAGNKTKKGDICTLKMSI